MIAVQDPLIGELGALDPGDDIVEGTHLPVEGQLHVDLRRPRADVIRDRQRPAPRLRRDRALQPPQQRQRVGVGDRQYGDFQQGLCFGAIQLAAATF
jgi:hypothetical protein